MRPQDSADWTHPHVFDESSVAAERGTRLVMLITAAMMVVEIAAGMWFNSMALLADGWHMSSHALAIGLSAVAYAAARRYARDPRFAFGTWKIEVLAGFASAIFLLGIAAWMVAGSLERLYDPQPIQFAEAIFVAVVGLVVNIVCAVILAGAHDHHGHDEAHGEHGHAHGHDHHHGHHHHDLNLKSAYLHVVADAATSVLAIVALAGGMMFGWNRLDPIMGIVGAVLVAAWAQGLLRETGRVLLDREMDHPVVDEVRAAIAARWGAAAQIADLHVWRVGKRRYACIVGIVSDDADVTPQAVKAALAEHEELVHVTAEINRNAHRGAAPAAGSVGLLGHRRIGDGPRPVLVLHEWLGDHANWEPLWPLLDTARFSYVFADLRGYGWSRDMAGAYTADEAAADALRLMDHYGFRRFHVVGHSMSAMVAQKLLAFAPGRVAGIVAVSPVPASGFAADAETLRAMAAVIDDDGAARRAIAVRTGGRYGEAWIARKLGIARRARPEAMRGYLAMFTGTDFAAAVKGDPTPMLAIVGRHDIPFYREESVRALLAPLYPNLTLIVSEEAGHYAMLETPAFVAAQIERFAGAD